MLRSTAPLLLALLSLAMTVAIPKITLQQSVYRYIFVLDITQSMNARDYHLSGMANDRLSFAKQSLQTVLQDLPCGSEVGLGVFATKNALLLFEPIEVCSHFAVIDDTLAHIDWRMAWAGDSNVARGLYTAIRILQKLNNDTRLVFLSDGEQTTSELHAPPLARHAGKIAGLIVGVGGLSPVALPHLDEHNQITGYWSNSEVGRSKNDLTQQGQQHYLSALNEPHLIQLADMTHLHYHRLETPDKLSEALRTVRYAEQRPVATDIRWIFSLISLLLILGMYYRTHTGIY